MLVNKLKSISVATYFLFVPITQEGFAKDNGTDAGLIDLNTLDAVRRDRTFD